MEKPSSSDTEQTNQIETLTYTVGQSALPETPFLDIIYTERDGQVYLAHDGNDFILHAKVEGPVTHNRLKHFDRIFLSIILGLIERGVDHVIAWVPEDQKKKNFAKYFGFEPINSFRILNDMRYQEMIYVIPQETDATQNV